jgi:hypothetical protein
LQVGKHDGRGMGLEGSAQCEGRNEKLINFHIPTCEIPPHLRSHIPKEANENTRSNGHASAHTDPRAGPESLI